MIEALPVEKKLKVVFMGPANSIHTARWVNALHGRGVDVTVLSLASDYDSSRSISSEIQIIYLASHSRRFKPYVAGLAARRLMRSQNCDVVNAHYISTYGIIASITGKRPLLLSAWGSDVYDYPLRSKLRLHVMRRILRHADGIASTSQVMAGHIRGLLNQPDRPISITPFGVDIKLFRHLNRPQRNQLIIGVVKTLEPKYGIEYLIQAFGLIKQMEPDIPLELRICGEGSQRQALEQLAAELGIADRVRFLGFVQHRELPAVLHDFDIFCAPSVEESFGVAVVEAMACGLPCVTSDADGFREVMVDGSTGFVVPRRDARALAEKLLLTIKNEGLRLEMGRMGRKRVESLYDWEKNVDTMVTVYLQMKVHH